MRTLMLAGVLVCGCASARAKIRDLADPQAKWVGKSENELLAHYGAPNLSAALADSSHVLTWIATGDATVRPSYVPGVAATVEQSQCRMNFTISREG